MTERFKVLIWNVSFYICIKRRFESFSFQIGEMTEWFKVLVSNADLIGITQLTKVQILFSLSFFNFD